MSLAPGLPTVWRPRLGRIVPYAMAATVLIVLGLVALLLPPWVALDTRVALVLIALFLTGVLLVLARPRIAANDQGLHVVNLVHSRRLEWAEIIDVSMIEGEPWPTFDLADGTTLPAMGIQSADGDFARRAFEELKALLKQRAQADEP